MGSKKKAKVKRKLKSSARTAAANGTKDVSAAKVNLDSVTFNTTGPVLKFRSYSKEQQLGKKRK